MPYEDIEIRIGRDGKIYLRVDGVSEERIRSFREFLEEEIGPVSAVEIVRDPDWDRPAVRTADEAAARKDQEELERKNRG